MPTTGGTSLSKIIIPVSSDETLGVEQWQVGIMGKLVEACAKVSHLQMLLALVGVCALALTVRALSANKTE